jgi:hypothetical protein
MGPYRSASPPPEVRGPRWGSEWRRLWCCLFLLRRCVCCGQLKRKGKMVRTRLRRHLIGPESDYKHWHCKFEFTCGSIGHVHYDRDRKTLAQIWDELM